MGSGPDTASRMSARPRHGSAIRPGFGLSIRRGARRRRKRSPIRRTLRWPNSKPNSATASFLCTQNVDDLHERAGSMRLHHMHGELAKSRCERECGRPPVEDHAIYASLAQVPRCACGGRLRPHIVFFGEMPLEMDRIQREIDKATVMLVVGTSGSVYPAANFVHWARQNGARTIYIGPEPPLNASAFTQIVEGKAGKVMPGLFEVAS